MAYVNKRRERACVKPEAQRMDGNWNVGGDVVEGEDSIGEWVESEVGRQWKTPNNISFPLVGVLCCERVNEFGPPDFLEGDLTENIATGCRWDASICCNTSWIHRWTASARGAGIELLLMVCLDSWVSLARQHASILKYLLCEQRLASNVCKEMRRERAEGEETNPFAGRNKLWPLFTRLKC